MCGFFFFFPPNMLHKNFLNCLSSWTTNVVSCFHGILGKLGIICFIILEASSQIVEWADKAPGYMVLKIIYVYFNLLLLLYLFWLFEYCTFSLPCKKLFYMCWLFHPLNIPPGVPEFKRKNKQHPITLSYPKISISIYTYGSQCH